MCIVLHSVTSCAVYAFWYVVPHNAMLLNTCFMLYETKCYYITRLHVKLDLGSRLVCLAVLVYDTQNQNNNKRNKISHVCVLALLL